MIRASGCREPWTVQARRSTLVFGLVRMYSIPSNGDRGRIRFEAGWGRAMSRSDAMTPKGRGAGSNPSSRFDSTHYERELEQVADDEEYLKSLNRPPTDYLPDRSRTIIARNDSPDVGFDASINPYRGCEHGCIYCYARPTHEFLGYSAGLDFETKILVKEDAPSSCRPSCRRRSGSLKCWP